MVHTLNMVHLKVVSDDRRERAREKKKQRFLDAASNLIDRDGLSGVTMQAIADEMDCAVGTIYTYFPSKASLITALQSQAISILEASYKAAEPKWKEVLADADLERELEVLVYLEAWGGFLAAASVLFGDEFQLVRLMLTSAVVGGDSDDHRTTRSLVSRLIEPGRRLLDEAVAEEVVEQGDNIQRSLRWVCALQGILALEALAPLDRHLFRTALHARELTNDLLVGWGADRLEVEVAGSHVEHLATLGPLAPPPEGPGFET